MEIDLSQLHLENIDTIDISGTYNLDSSYFDSTDIVSLSDIKVEGTISKKDNEETQEDYIECTIEGNMIIPDSISLEEVEYPFSIEYDDFLLENYKKSENILDIFAFLWENILLEVPLQFTKVRDLSKFHGDGWKLVSEDDIVHDNNPFSELLKDFEKE